MSEELKPCPFCGRIPTKNGWDTYVANHTKECFLYSILANIPTKLEEAWNKRYSEENK